MDLMLELISLTTKIFAFLVQEHYTEGSVTILHRHSRRKTNVKFVNNDIFS